MEATLKLLNELEHEGVISRYAIGGAVGAIFYMEPFLTYDLDMKEDYLCGVLARHQLTERFNTWKSMI